MIQLRPLTTHADFHQMEDVQRKTWDIPDIEIVPTHLTHALQQNGACLIGAFDGETMVGFVFGVLATSNQTTSGYKMYSVMAGVLPAYRDHSVGYQLKLAQRDFALAQGLELITWTYDPLESRNGRFNIHKLGAICHTYHRNHHGDLTGINAGLPTDRFDVEWWINNPPPQSSPHRGGNPILTLGDSISNLQSPTPNLLVEIPTNFQAIKQQDPALARRWRTETRHLFENLFQMGYTVTDFIYRKESGSPRSFYQLQIDDRD